MLTDARLREERTSEGARIARLHVQLEPLYAFRQNGGFTEGLGVRVGERSLCRAFQQ